MLINFIGCVHSCFKCKSALPEIIKYNFPRWTTNKVHPLPFKKKKKAKKKIKNRFFSPCSAGDLFSINGFHNSYIAPLKINARH